ncbi:phage tail protein [Undibacterium seohonense]|uniref:Phage tail protein n=1 Tax=Undibacterium seohonense TaxID=1344950 RepID=A0ABR6X2J1_9BURK|nr:tail fiber protein [Undibacterium seohonense]MBC3807170.1 phage tail protein [Undibacterium seohonense]
MADPFIGEIRMFAGNFAPRSWMFCNGQLLSIAEYTTLFALIGTTYGGDGQTTYALPDLRGRIPLHRDSNYPLGSEGGQEMVTLNSTQLPAHSHAFGTLAATASAPNGNATHTTPIGNRFAGGAIKAYATGGPTVAMNNAVMTAAGGSQAHDNLMPYLAINFIICLEGIFPSRN